LEHTNFSTRLSASTALSRFGSNAVPAIPVIERLINKDPEKVHGIMLRVLEQCGPEARRAIPTLRMSAATGERHLSIHCARTLWSVDPSQADFVRPIARRLSEAQDPGIQIESADLLWRMDKDPAPVVPILVRLLKREKNPYDYRTVLLLREIGPGARDAIPALNEQLKRSRRRESFFFRAGEEALQAMGGVPSSGSGDGEVSKP
jgi:hypothetical protein